jgi:hypothetical protein
MHTGKIFRVISCLDKIFVHHWFGMIYAYILHIGKVYMLNQYLGMISVVSLCLEMIHDLHHFSGKNCIPI